MVEMRAEMRTTDGMVQMRRLGAKWIGLKKQSSERKETRLGEGTAGVLKY